VFIGDNIPDGYYKGVLTGFVIPQFGRKHVQNNTYTQVMSALVLNKSLLLNIHQRIAEKQTPVTGISRHKSECHFS